METAEWITALDDAGVRMADAAEAAGMGAEVPPCPGWLVRDLLLHTGGVHRWATTFVATGAMEPIVLPEAQDIADDVPEGDAAAELVPWFRDGHATLVAALRAAPADLECWTFLRAPSPLEHWARRQAHETAMHAVDAEAAAGKQTPVPQAFAADGVDELLSCFGPRYRRTLRLDAPRTLHVQATDTGDEWTMRIGTERAVVSREAPEVPADTVLRATAEQLYLALWNRAPLAPLRASGDPALLAEWPNLLAVRWS